MLRSLALGTLLAGCVGSSSSSSPPTGSTAQDVKTSVDSARVPATFLNGKRPHEAERGTIHNPRVGARKPSGVPGIDSIVNFTGSFTADGFDSDGNPQSVWPYSMVGRAPEENRSTHIRAPIVPVNVELLDASGNVATTSTGAPLRLVVAPDIVSGITQSPIYGSFDYNSGRGQFNDQMMRTQFWDRFDHHHNDDGDGGYHTVLDPSVKAARTMRLPFGSYQFALNADGTCCAFILADAGAFSTQLFPSATVDNSTVIGSAEVSGDMTTRDITTFLFRDVYLYDGDPSNCCILGFHSYDLEPGDAHNGNRERRFVMNFSSWITPGFFGFGFEDITAASHEMSETFGDPFVDDATPWWLSIDPFFGNGLCQNNLETGDVIEVLSANPVHAIPMHGRTYHPQNEALLPWFAFESPSTARAGTYSFPDETTLMTLSPGPLLPGCSPAP